MISVVLSQLSVLFLMVATGYLLTRNGSLREHFQDDLAQLILWVALPCAIIESGFLEKEKNSLASVVWLIGLSVASYAVAILLAEGLRRVIRQPSVQGNLISCMTVFANTAFIGYPVCLALLGNKGVFYASFFNMVFNLFFFTYGIRQINGRMDTGVARMLFTDSGMLATVGMVVVFLFQYKPPEPLRVFVNHMSALCTPLSMIMIGCMLAKMNLRAILQEKSYWLLTGFRLLVIPLFILICVLPLTDFGVDKDILFVIIIMWEMPIGSLTAIYAQKYNRASLYVSGGIVHSMIGFCVCFPLVLLLARFLIYGGG